VATTGIDPGTLGEVIATISTQTSDRAVVRQAEGLEGMIRGGWWSWLIWWVRDGVGGDGWGLPDDMGVAPKNDRGLSRTRDWIRREDRVLRLLGVGVGYALAP
jgi:hypothetical protein